MSSLRVTSWQWLRNGDEVFPAMLTAIDAAQESVRLETYTFSDDGIGRTFLAALLRALQRGVRVKVLVDGIGSLSLPTDFFASLVAAGGEARVFNPPTLKRVAIRNHRKLITRDAKVAFIGGFNISDEYTGDGITRGWSDLGLQIEGNLVSDLVGSFEAMFALADFRHKRMARLWRAKHKQSVVAEDVQLLLGGPGRGANPIRRALHRDLARVRLIQIIEAYFLPSWRIRRAFARAARAGGEVQLVLAGKSDVALSHHAGRSLYQHLLKAGVRIFEYQPQVLHTKLMILGEAAYVGSANLDPRSLTINYELMVRFENPKLVAEARAIFDAARQQTLPIDPVTWKHSRSFWTRLKERGAYLLLARIDPHLARQQFKSLPD